MLGVRADEKLEGHANVGAEPSNWGVKARRKGGRMWGAGGATLSMRATVFSI